MAGDYEMKFSQKIRNKTSKITRFVPFWTPVILLVSLAFLTSCADREHANPLDPLNPKTHGRPPRPSAVSDHHKVILSWPAANLNPVTGFAVYRRADSSKAEKIATLPAGRTGFVDSNTVYGTRYSYAYSILSGDFESLRSPAEAITPGPSFFWVSYRSSGQILKLTFDIQHPYIWLNGFAFPSVSVVVGKGKGIWVADEYLGELSRVSSDGRFLYKIQGFGRITSFQLDENRGRLWVADSKNKRVVNLDTSGVGRFAVRGLRYPRQVLVSPASEGCWILDSGLKQILFADPDGNTTMFTSDLRSPQWMALDSENDGLWVADSSRVVHFDLLGKKTKEIKPFKYAYFLAVDPARQNLWVLDQSYLWFGTEVVAVTANGKTVFRKRGFEAPRNLVVDGFDGSCVIADTYNARLVKLSSKGEQIAVWETDDAPWWVSIEE